MRLLTQSILVVFAGLWVGGCMIGRKRASLYYDCALDSRSVPPDTAGYYWKTAITEKPELADVQDAGRAKMIVRQRFREDLHRIQWTWDRELRWKEAPAKFRPASVPMPPQHISVP